MSVGTLVGWGALALPLGAGIALGLAPLPVKRVRQVGLAAMAVATAALAVALWLGASGAVWAVGWLPDAGALTLELGRSGLQAALVTTVAALVALALVEAPRRWVLATGLICLGAANVAYLSGHFLGRYVALEVVALCVAVVPLMERAERDGPQIAWAVYILLRLGDAGLMMAILLLWRITGTLDIDAALARTQGGGPSVTRWVAAGLALAVWLKMGAWPLQAWIEAAQSLSPFSRSWTFATVLPNLGFYLLYRVTPLLAARDAAPRWLGWGGLLAALVAGVGALVLVRRGAWRRSLVYLGAAQAGLALALAASGQGALLLRMLLLTTLPRLALYCAEAIHGREGGRICASIAGGTLAWAWAWAVWTTRASASVWAAVGAGAVLLMLGWTAVAAASPCERTLRGPPIRPRRAPGEGPLGAIAEVVYRWVERGLLGGLVSGLAEAVQWTSQTAHSLVEQRLLGGLVSGLTKGVFGASQTAHALVEQGALDGSLRLVARTVRGASARMARWHTGRLRANLLWVMLSLAALTIWAVSG